MFVNKRKMIRSVALTYQQFSFPAHFRPSFMDPDWFGYATSGTLIVSWAGASRRGTPEPPMGFSGSALEMPLSREAPTRAR